MVRIPEGILDILTDAFHVFSQSVQENTVIID